MLSRQKLPVLDAGQYPATEGAAKGAYVLADCDGSPQIIIMASGAEVHLALAACEELKKRKCGLPGGIHAQLGYLRRAGSGLPR